MSKNNTVTCLFSMDRDVYNAFKSIISRNGENGCEKFPLSLPQQTFGSRNFKSYSARQT